MTRAVGADAVLGHDRGDVGVVVLHLGEGGPGAGPRQVASSAQRRVW